MPVGVYPRPPRQLIDLTCHQCGASFQRIPSWVGRYCSNPCKNSAWTARRRDQITILPIEIQDDGTARVPLRGKDGLVRAYAIIDACDAALVGRHAWQLDGTHGYAIRTDRSEGKRRTISLHRMLLGLKHGDPLHVDHINRRRLDDRRANLRTVKRPENYQNVPGHRGATSVYRGVWKNAQSINSWSAKVGRIYLGVFPTEEAAASAAREARARLMPFATD